MAGDATPTTAGYDSMNSSQISVTQKKLKARRAVIADSNEDDVSKALKRSTSSDKSKDISQTLEGNKDHLETKKQIEELRNKYGDSWLHSHGASKVHSVIGISSPVASSANGSYFKAGPPETTEQLIENFFGTDPSMDGEQRTSTPLNMHRDNATLNVGLIYIYIISRSSLLIPMRIERYIHIIYIYFCSHFRHLRLPCLVITKQHRLILIIIRTQKMTSLHTKPWAMMI